MDISLIMRTVIVSITILAGVVVLRFARQEDIKKLQKEVMQQHDIDFEFYLVGENVPEEQDKQRQAEMALDLVTTKASTVQ